MHGHTITTSTKSQKRSTWARAEACPVDATDLIVRRRCRCLQGYPGVPMSQARNRTNLKNEKAKKEMTETKSNHCLEFQISDLFEPGREFDFAKLL
jgi:hypothetical protein